MGIIKNLMNKEDDKLWGLDRLGLETMILGSAGIAALVTALGIQGQQDQETMVYALMVTGGMAAILGLRKAYKCIKELLSDHYQ